MAFLIFTASSVAVTALWNRFYDRVPTTFIALFWLLTCVYQWQTLFTAKVDLPALGYVAYPWKALPQKSPLANTGIVFTQLAPWTEAAHRAVFSGEVPFWNRYAACGTPLMPNQQTAFLHPFNLLGLLLPTGKAFTLSASLRLFFVQLFMFIFLRRRVRNPIAAVFGSLAFAFCSFQIVWLLFPLGLATMMLPLNMVGIDEIAKRPSYSGALPLICGVTLTLLGGHPESAAWVLIVTGLYALYIAATEARSARFLIAGALAMAAGVALSAVFWYPTWRLLPFTARGEMIAGLRAHPPEHRFTSEWILPLIAPNVLGTNPTGTYRAPRPFNAGVLDDYGEVASGYAGLLSLAFAFVALTTLRDPFRIWLLLLAAFSVAAITETEPLRTLIIHTPLLGMTLVGRLRFALVFSVAILAALGLDDLLASRNTRRTLWCFTAAYACTVFAYQGVITTDDALRRVHLLYIGVITIVFVGGVIFVKQIRPWALCALLLADLVSVTFRYNPPSRAREAYPLTGAISFLQSHARVSRFAAVGWSFLPETPSFYGIEDVKTTDPFASPDYQRLLRAFLDISAADYDQIIHRFAHPFASFLGIRYIYVPADQTFNSDQFIERYRDPDGRVIENPDALPRYFSVNDIAVTPSFDSAFSRLQSMTDYRHAATVDAIPDHVAPRQPQIFMPGADVRLLRYGNSFADIQTKGNAWNLVVSSDVAWPGWTARWNNRELAVAKVNGVFLGVFVPPGTGVLHLRYVPPGFYAGAAVSVATLAMLLLLRTAGFSRLVRRL